MPKIGLNKMSMGAIDLLSSETCFKTMVIQTCGQECPSRWRAQDREGRGRPMLTDPMGIWCNVDCLLGSGERIL